MGAHARHRRRRRWVICRAWFSTGRDPRRSRGDRPGGQSGRRPVVDPSRDRIRASRWPDGWSGWSDSNRRSRAPKARALPTTPHPVAAHSVAEPRFDVVVWHDPVEPDAGKRRGGLPPRVGVAVTGSGSDRNARGRLRLAMIGAGWITQIHLEALDRLGRTTLVGVAATREESVRALATPRGAEAYTDIDRMLDEQRPDAAYVAVPPSEAVAMLDRL